MGNRAVITTRERKVGLYLHWNGGRDTVEPLLRYCELQGYRPPSDDDYGWARLAQVVGNFFGGALSVGVGSYTTDVRMDPGDNGIYVIDGWRIAERLRAERREDGPPRVVRFAEGREEQRCHGFDEMLRAFDEAMPERLRLGEFLESVEVPVGELRVGDEVWLRGVDGSWGSYPRRRVRPAGVQQDPRPGRDPRRHGEDRVPRPALRRPLRPRRGLLLELQQLRPRRHGEDQATSRGRLAPRGRPSARPGGRPFARRPDPPRASPTPPDPPAPPRSLHPRREPGAPSRAAKTFRAGGALPRRAEAQALRVSLPPLRGRPNPGGDRATRRGEGPGRNDQGGQRWRI